MIQLTFSTKAYLHHMPIIMQAMIIIILEKNYCLTNVLQCTTSMVQSYVVHYRTALCNIDLHCAPWSTRGHFLFMNYCNFPDRFTMFTVNMLRWCTWAWPRVQSFGSSQCTYKSRFTMQFCTDVWSDISYLSHVKMKNQ